MTPSKLRSEVVLERVAWIDRMIGALRALPTRSLEEFRSDTRTAAAAESYLRRALEALFDLCRHVLAKGLGQGVAEYEEIADDELLDICTRQLGDIEAIRERLLSWLRAHPELLDTSL